MNQSYESHSDTHSRLLHAPVAGVAGVCGAGRGIGASVQVVCHHGRRKAGDCGRGGSALAGGRAARGAEQGV